MLSNTHFSMAVHILCALAYNDGEIVGSDQLARTVGTNSSFLRGLIGQLKEAGLVETRLGKGGGSTLGRAASEISLHDVFQATESQPAVKTHTCDDKSKCVVARGMDEILANVNERIEAVVETELTQITVADLVSSYIDP